MTKPCLFILFLMCVSHLSIGQYEKKLDKIAQKTFQKIGKDSSVYISNLDTIDIKVIKFSSHSKTLNYIRVESLFEKSGSQLFLCFYLKDKKVFLVETLEKYFLKSSISGRRNYFYYNKDGTLFHHFGRIGFQPHGIGSDVIHIDNTFLKAQGYNPTLDADFLIQYIENLKKTIL